MSKFNTAFVRAVQRVTGGWPGLPSPDLSSAQLSALIQALDWKAVA